MTILIEDLSFRYGPRLALDNVTFSADAGAVVGLLGNNGAGKSTIFKIVCGLLKPFSGTVVVNGHALREHRSQVRATLGYVAQRFGLYEDLTVLENLHFFANAYGLDGAAASERVNAVLDRFELHGRKQDQAGSLSQGWKQRLALATALVHRPSVLLLDEATAGLDMAARKYAWTVIDSEAAAGVTVLLSTHHSDEAQRCHQTIWLQEGRIQ